LGFKLRDFRPEDLDDVLSINRTCLPENYSPYFFMSIHRRYPDLFLVAELDGRVVGYIMCRIEKSFFGWSTKGHVISIAVMPEHRRMGIATSLMKEAMARMANRYGASECYLEVRVSNTPAISLYEKLGFRKDRIVPNYYLDGEDAYIMKKPLSSDAS